MKKLTRLGRSIMAAALLLVGVCTLQSCEEDAPAYSHSIAELATSWVWNTQEGDAADDFQVEIEQVSDNEFYIVNFHNLDGEKMLVNVSGSKLSFAGEMVDGNVVVENGTGNISNGWITMRLEYDIVTDETEHFVVELNQGKAQSKKAVAYIAQ